MLKKILAIVMALFMASAFAASVEINSASQADLEKVKGIGPATATKILDERKKGQFKDWPDLMKRMKGIRDAKASKLSAEGLTVSGASFAAAAPKAADGASKPAAKAKTKAEKTEEAASKPAAKK
jgi:competence protein ComEA